jgi:hypothetical protein
MSPRVGRIDHVLLDPVPRSGSEGGFDAGDHLDDTSTIAGGFLFLFQLIVA